MSSIMKFTKGEIAWAIVTGTSMVIFACSLLIWFGINDVPWFFEPNSYATVLARFISLLVLATCLIFHPQERK